ncbi:hypothetical protein NPX13_g6754 [Xylaria arbuscula]|uniref:DM2 domain-containing protein n=1 Tax=Xylaria arbuscula TaxID=114810 RepID=A0A9W8TJU4_9PEZI|nr:hypothetical protein NPX13_g6754 [Xylaria arbuscula]
MVVAAEGQSSGDGEELQPLRDYTQSRVAPVHCPDQAIVRAPQTEILRRPFRISSAHARRSRRDLTTRWAPHPRSQSAVAGAGVWRLASHTVVAPRQSTSHKRSQSRSRVTEGTANTVTVAQAVMMQPGYRPYPQHQQMVVPPPPPQHQQHHPQSQQPQRVSYSGGSSRKGGIGPMMSAGPHHQMPAVSQAQQARNQQEAALQFEMAKRRSRKPTDKNLPDGIDDCIVGDVSKNYRELRDFERRLDATMTRKRLDIVDAVNRSAKRWKTLRIWITNTAENQIWQGNGLNVDTFDFNSNLEPTYRVKVEARLLDDDEDIDSDGHEETKGVADEPDRMEEDGPADSKDKTSKPPRYRFSHFFKALHVDFPDSRGGAEQGVEWKKPERVGGSPNLPAAADFDELTFKRNGDENLNITINLIRHEDPERYALSPQLEDIVDMREATRQEIVMGLWEYIKMMGLQEDEEKRNFRCDELLRSAFGGIETGAIFKLTDYISPHLQPLPPVQLPYTIRLDEEFHKDPQPTIYDVRVAVDDPLREQMTAFLNNAGYAGMLKEVASLDEKLAIIVQAIHVSKAKHGFLQALSEDPATFVRNWLSSQKRDLDVILGEAMRGGGEDANGDEWRKGGKDSIWGTVNARESVNSLLSRMPTQPQPR